MIATSGVEVANRTDVDVRRHRAGRRVMGEQGVDLVEGVDRPNASLANGPVAKTFLIVGSLLSCPLRNLKILRASVRAPSLGSVLVMGAPSFQKHGDEERS